MIRRFLFWGSVGLLAVIVVASLMPGTWRPHTPLTTRMEHLATYGLVAFWFAVVLRPIWLAILSGAGLSVLSGLMEVIQTRIPGRSGEWADFYYSTVGAVAGTGVGMALVLCAGLAWRRWTEARASG